METPHLPQSIFGKDFENVYEPAEDTFLLLDALENDLDYLKTYSSTCLEIGSGSGTVITAISKAFNRGSLRRPRLMIATDINLQACKTTRKSSQYHEQVDVQVVRTNLAESLFHRLEESVDLLIFNPPYVPTTNEEVEEGALNQLYLSWAGGHHGRRLTDIFVHSYIPRLLSKPYGVAYLVALESNKPLDLLELLSDKYHIRGTVVLKRKAGTELLSIIKYSYTC